MKVFNKANKKEIDDILSLCLNFITDKKQELRVKCELFLKNYVNINGDSKPKKFILDKPKAYQNTLNMILQRFTLDNTTVNNETEIDHTPINTKTKINNTQNNTNTIVNESKNTKSKVNNYTTKNINSRDSSVDSVKSRNNIKEEKINKPENKPSFV